MQCELCHFDLLAMVSLPANSTLELCSEQPDSCSQIARISSVGDKTTGSDKSARQLLRSLHKSSLQKSPMCSSGPMDGIVPGSGWSPTPTLPFGKVRIGHEPSRRGPESWVVLVWTMWDIHDSYLSRMSRISRTQPRGR